MLGKIFDKTISINNQNGFIKPDPGFIPYASFYSPDTVLTKNGELIQTIRILGFSYDVDDENRIDLRESVRNAISKVITSPEYAIWFHTIRSKRSLDLGGKYSNFVSQNNHEDWCKKNYWRDKYVNELYISIVIEGENISMNPITHFGNFMRSLSFNVLKKFHEQKLESKYKKLNYAVNTILKDLEQFNAMKLTMVQDAENVYSEQLQFISKLIHLHERDVPVPVKDISEYLSNYKMALGNNVFEVIANNQKNFAEVVTIKSSQSLPAAALDELLQSPVNMVVTESIDFLNFEKVKSIFTDQATILDISGDDLLKDSLGLTELENKNTNSPVSFGEHQISIMFIGKDVPSLKMEVAKAVQKIRKLGILYVNEDLEMENTYWSQLPGNFTYLHRMRPVALDEIASFATLYEFVAGRLSNPWGNAVTVFRTTPGTPYFFNFHYKEDAHTVVVGFDRCGKTTAINFLLCEASKYDALIVNIGDNSSLLFQASFGEPVIEFGTDRFKKFGINPFHYLGNPDSLHIIIEMFSALIDLKDEIEKEELKLLLQHLADRVSGFTLEAIFALNITDLGDSCRMIFERIKLAITSETYRHFFADHSSYDNTKFLGLNLSYLSKQKFSFRQAYIKIILLDLALKLKSNKAIISFDDLDEYISDEASILFLEKILKDFKDKNYIALFSLKVNIDDKDHFISKFIHSQFCTKLIMANDPNHAKRNPLPGFDKMVREEIKEMKILNRHFMILQGKIRIVTELNLTSLKRSLKIFSATEEDLNNFFEFYKLYPDSSDSWFKKLYETK